MTRPPNVDRSRLRPVAVLAAAAVTLGAVSSVQAVIPPSMGSGAPSRASGAVSGTVASAPPIAAGLAARLERNARKIERTIRKRHLPHGTIFDPRFPGPGSSQITDYVNAGDSAIWTGHYLAAQAFRYAATGDPKAKKAARRLIAAIGRLVTVTGSDVLARAAIPKGSPWTATITVWEAHQGVFNGTVDGQEYIWSGGTTRDQYSGVVFGLAWAWELIPASRVRAEIEAVITPLLLYLIRHAWTVQMPDGSFPTTFLGRPDQQLALLQVGRRINPTAFAEPYNEVRRAVGKQVGLPISIEVRDPHGSYFKFNLDAINLVNLVRLETDSAEFQGRYREAYDTLRKALRNHGNAHFNMIDRVLDGPNPARDRETRKLLKAWLKRPRRNTHSDVSDKYSACGENRACDPVPVTERPATDFVWQRSPFVLAGGGGGDIEYAGIDLLLPYWMARYFGVI